MATAKVEASKFQLTALTLFREANQISSADDGVIFSLGSSIFDNSICRKVLISSFSSFQIIRIGRKWTPVLDKIILILICILCFAIRQFAVIRHESMIHEFDPYFNLRTTIYLQNHGFYEFWNWFDDGEWDIHFIRVIEEENAGRNKGWNSLREREEETMKRCKQRTLYKKK
ncbi:hypothetical protein IE077_000421 [Cardiosporidium cionae]|uniref:dolichyl-diphosphooligosaccharide--protein glycotransferase n=1 Tax=Cardiosporidium cionae TaxID=476202 RepID=A0ABQ7J4J7_9APIC|nr:hypothetical protein IE077_000421 [Cardiosporidium cionae]|eukprot:KAF8817915.1 hypothetical protein IE077_000421 [Cardiosporidium cionae]